MIDYNKIPRLKQLVAFRQNDNADYPLLEPDLLESNKSQIVVQDLHDLLTLENLYHCTQRKQNILDSAVISKKLREKVNASCKAVIQNTIIRKISEEKTQNVIQEYVVHSSSGNRRDEVVKSGRFVGYEVKQLPVSGVAVNIPKIGLQLSQAQTVKMYVFHASQYEPVQTFDLVYDRAKSMQFFDVDILLSHENSSRFQSDYDDFYIGYFEDEITGNAIYRNIGTTFSTCNCNNNIDKMRFVSNYARARPISVSSADLDGTNLFDISGLGYGGVTFGLNLNIQAVCDFTEYIDANASRFSTFIAQQVKVDFLSMIAYSTENSGISEKLINRAMFALRGEHGNSEAKELERMIKAFTFDLSNMNSPCFGMNHGGVKVSSY